VASFLVNFYHWWTRRQELRKVQHERTALLAYLAEAHGIHHVQFTHDTEGVHLEAIVSPVARLTRH